MESAVIRSIHFTCIGKGHGAPCLPASKEDWEALRRESWLAQMCARIEKGDEELKHRLPVWTPHCAEFANNHRAIADAVKPLNRLMLDFDEKGHTDDIVRDLTPSPSPNGEGSEMTIGGMVVLLIEDSVRRGTHVLVELPEGMTPEEAQALMQEATGFTPDAAVKDVARCIYMVPEDHTKYVSLKLFEVSISSPELGEARRGLNEGTSEAGPVAENEAVQTTPTPPNLGGEIKCTAGVTNSSPESGEVRRGLNKESKATIQFALMMAEYCLSQQMKTFGEALRNEYINAQDECQRYGANHSIFDRLAPTFSREDLRALKQDCSDSGLRNIIMRWKRDGWIEAVDRHHWKKASHCPIVPTSH